jgi:hypothetical protein
MEKYEKEYEKNLKYFYDTIPERNQRLLIGLHSFRLGTGSDQYVSNLFGCDIDIISDCRKELENISSTEKK